MGKDGIVYKVNWTPAQRAQMRKLPREVVKRAIKYIAVEVWGEMRDEAPVGGVKQGFGEGGRLSGSFDLKKLSKFAWAIYSGVHYALYVHEGTGLYGPKRRRYKILPVNKKALYWKGARHPVKSVMHPGQRPNPYIHRAIIASTKRWKEFVKRAMSEVNWAD